jgi:hypothetical protein
MCKSEGVNEEEIDLRQVIEEVDKIVNYNGRLI